MKKNNPKQSSDRKEVCVFGTQKLPRDLRTRGKLAFAPIGRQRFFQQFTGDFGATGKIPIVSQLYILLILQSQYFEPEKS
ncbi:MAG: hypothetical protein ACXVB0_20460 [Mucilaginibacter sp.]